MLIKFYHVYIFLFSISNVYYIVSSEPISIIAGSSVLVATWFGWDSIKSNTICRYMECCNERYIPYDLDSEYVFIVFRIVTYVYLYNYSGYLFTY